MDTINLVLAIVGGALSFVTCRPDLTPEGVGGAVACSVLVHAAADHQLAEEGTRNSGSASRLRARAEARATSPRP